MIDRISPTIRPNRKAAGYQQWRSLLFMHWSIPTNELRPLIPKSLELDLYDGSAFVGVVPFAMKGVRPRWCPRALSFAFLETNVRTYVTYRGRPGVYFFSLDAASRIGVWVAKRFWGLPYSFAKMSLNKTGESIDYLSIRQPTQVRHESRCKIGGPLGQSQPDSIEFFFLERYLMFLERKARIYSGQVHHKPYPVRQATVLYQCDELREAAGCGCISGLPEFAHYSTGVDVEIFQLQCGETS